MMAVGFGFSVSDLFVGLRLIKDSIEAFHDTKGSPASYASLAREIACLLDGLEAVEELRSDQSFSKKQSAALQRAAYSCQQTIDGFLRSISKYQQHLTIEARGLRSNYRKIKWALCKKDEIANFKSEIGRHASSINMLLITFRARQDLSSTSIKVENSVIVSKEAQDEVITGMLKNLSADQRQIFATVMRQNKELLQSVSELKKMLELQAAVPPQVLLQQPVILLDPFGKTAPFHLDFIDSCDCFMSVRKSS